MAKDRAAERLPIPGQDALRDEVRDVVRLSPASAEGLLMGARRGATEVLAAFATAPRPSPQANAHAVGRVLQDTIGVAMAGVGTETGRLTLSWLETERAPGPAAVWGTGLRLAPSQAALVNGTTAHALDWDDAAPSMAMHPGAVLLPALLAQAAAEDVSGARLVAAYNIGSAVFRAVSEALPLPFHYGRGWHNTSSTGRLAATAALAHLTGLDTGATRHALGIAASCAAGSLANFGTMTKPLHAGLAARDAVTAIGLARRGFTANPHQLEAPRGFFAAYGDTSFELLATLGERLAHWESAWTTDWALKRYPSCYATHLAIDSALELRRRLADPGPSRIARIRVSVPASSTSPLLDRLPVTGLEGKFSLAYTVARALVDGRVELADFTDDRVLHDAAVRRLTDLFELERRDTDDDPTCSHTTVEVTLNDGQAQSHGADVTYGDARNPLTDADLDAKFAAALAEADWNPAEAAALGERLRRATATPSLAPLQDALCWARGTPSW
ncbi:MmgE/PrpD family protein [Streptomyces sp. NPDC052042]|uniref:MmgE/PrpD family protein n=1 Tax=Streptomyces sp. NPDC052042 TaxID=3365683 RepID=UPI0037D2F3AC